MPRHGYRVGVPQAGRWDELVNTDAGHYAGSGVGNLGTVTADGPPEHGQPTSVELSIPPLGVVWLTPAAD